jgi:MATE family multidrug resistance protein
MARAPGAREILRFTGPLVLGLLTVALHSVIDTAFVARLGTAPVAAVGIAATLFFAGMMLFIGILRNSIAFVGRAFGERQPERIGPLLGQYQWIALAAAPLLWSVVLIYPAVAALSRLSPEVERLGWTYLAARLWGVPLLLTVVLYSALYQAIGNSVLPMAIAWGELALKCAFNYLLIFGHGGLPALGLPGAAWASVLAETVAAAAILGITHAGPLRPKFRLRLLGRLQLSLLGKVLAVGIPQGLGDAVEVLAYLGFFAIVGRLGEATLAANNIAIVTTQILFLPGFALGIAGSSYMGRFLGAGRPALAAQTTWRILAIGIGYMGLLGLPLWSFGAGIAGLYSSDGEVVRLAALAFKVMAVYQVCDGAGIVLRLTLGGAGDTRLPTLIMAASSGLILLPGAWWLSRAVEPGIVGGWIAAFVHMAVLAGLLLWRFQHGSWRRVRLAAADGVPQTA